MFAKTYKKWWFWKYFVILRVSSFFQKNSKFPIQDTFQNFWSTAAELFDFIKNIRILFHKIFAKTYLENDGFDYIVWFWDFSCFRPKTQNFRSSFKLLRPIGFRKKSFQIISNDNTCQYTSKNHDFDQFPWFRFFLVFGAKQEFSDPLAKL